MGLLGTADLLTLVLGVAAGAAICGYLVSSVRRRDRRRARGAFVLGFICGRLSPMVLRRRRRGINRLILRREFRTPSRAALWREMPSGFGKSLARLPR